MAEESVNTTETVTSNIYNVPRPLVKVQPLAAGDIHISNLSPDFLLQANCFTCKLFRVKT